MMEWETYLAFVTVCVLAIIVPGPTNALITANGMRHGMRAGLMNVAGTQIGLALMLAVVGLGLSSVIAAAGHWFEWIRLIGAALLIWIGWRMLRGAAGAGGHAAPPPKSPKGGFLLQGLLVALGNPKQLLFFGALVPQFIDQGSSHMLQIALLGLTALFIALLSDGAYAVASAKAGTRLSAERMRLMARTAGCALIGGGAWLALSRGR
jgi:homoserine/homoserine lactone efflux protein